MRYLVVLRGLPASGKSTFIENHGLAIYTLSLDRYKFTYFSPALDINGNFEISPSYSEKSWASLYADLEERMKYGEFTIIDATHIRKRYIDIYTHLCEKRNYKLIVVEFRASVEECIRRDKYRPFGVGSKIIEKMAEDWEELPKSINKMSPEILMLELFSYYSPLNFDNKKIYVFGKPPVKFIQDNVDMDKDILIFLDTTEAAFILSIIDKPNVFVCNKNTLSERVIPCLRFTHNKKLYIVSHGNISKPILNVFMPEYMYTNGVGKDDKEIKQACKSFYVDEDTIQIFCINNLSNKVKISAGCYNVGELTSSPAIPIVVIDKKTLQPKYIKGE